ncbi:WSC domain-containing protein [Pochonia chlamydosporia 170]|uniref:WSC domain-containing protein n=1 Tax=Pochonia chlamydosporia 170 TaxID=1380566 RepID=A0A179FXC5_METCM|nr:WSC domain-containing protein [Pochonia chlamydosporia 170]OAQ69761.1 WSC domain-containing protein [Pochonia chlamydosporia 170]
MRRSLCSLTSLILISQLCTASRYPEMQYDPNTTKDCIEWYNNNGDKSCYETRRFFELTAEEFAQWNPTVGLDCKTWIWASYCVMTQQKLNMMSSVPIFPSKTTQISNSTSASSTLGPSPTAWGYLGCYADSLERPVLERRVSQAAGDPFLTVSSCEDSCYRLDFRISGVKAGNQCWCSGTVSGQWTKNETECNMSCAGDNAQICGGVNCLNVFKAAFPETSTRIESTRTDEGKVAQTSQSESGARRNMALFWGRVW